MPLVEWLIHEKRTEFWISQIYISQVLVNRKQLIVFIKTKQMVLPVQCLVSDLNKLGVWRVNNG